jgi:hypothetical protein
VGKGAPRKDPACRALREKHIFTVRSLRQALRGAEDFDVVLGGERSEALDIGRWLVRGR